MLLLECFRHAMHSLWLCAFPVFSVLAGTALLVAVPQATEVLLTFADPTGESTAMRAGRLAWLFGTAGCWGLGNWYAARLMLQRRFPRDPEPPAHPFITAWQEWLPRVLGGTGPIVVGAFVLARGDNVREAVLGGSMLAAGIAVFVFTWLRRPVVNRLLKGERTMASAASTFSGLPAGSRVVLWIVFSVLLVVSAAVAAGGYGVTRLLKAPTLLFLWLTAITIVGSMVFVYLPKAFGGPSLIFAPAVVWIAFAQFGGSNNHVLSHRAAARQPVEPDPRPAAVDHFKAWLQSRDPQSRIVLVAAEGGASRSAWWTGHVLGTADHATGGAFSRQVFAASGISGGSLGVSTYAALLARRGAAPAGAAEPPTPPDDAACLRVATAPLHVQSACFTGRDFLSPIVGYMLFPDFLQRFLPVPVPSWDRSLGLELSWQRDWRGLFGGDAFARPLTDLYRGPGGWRTDLPVLMLGTAQVGSGKLAIQSSVRLPALEDNGDLASSTDFLAQWPAARNLPLATVVHNSARFPVVSPGGPVYAGEQYVDALVDGGYFEGSGAHALLVLLRQLEDSYRWNEWRELRRRMLVVFIGNEPPARDSRTGPGGCQVREPSVAPLKQEELLTPLIGLYNSRSPRGAAARADLKRYLSDGQGDAHVAMVDLLLDGPAIAKEPPSMTWYMTSQSRDRMWHSLGQGTCAGSALAKVFAQLDAGQAATWQSRLPKPADAGNGGAR